MNDQSIKFIFLLSIDLQHFQCLNFINRFIRFFWYSRHIIWEGMSKRIGSIDANFGSKTSTRTANHITVHKFLLQTVRTKWFYYARCIWTELFKLHSALLPMKWYSYSVLSDQIRWSAPNRWPNWSDQSEVRAVCVVHDHMNHYYPVMQLCQPLIYRALALLVWHRCINQSLGGGIASKFGVVHGVNAITGRHWGPYIYSTIFYCTDKS